MKSSIKKIVSLILAVLMVFSVLPVAAGAAGAENVTITTDSGETYDHYPQVVVKGFGAGCVKIYYEDDPEQKSLFWPLDEQRFIDNLKNVDDYIIKAIKKNQPNILRSVIYDYAMDCMGMLAFKPDGSMMDGVTAEPVGFRYRGQGKYEFYYDCRQSPVSSAQYLYECLDEVFEETNTEKIEVIGSSYGANIVTAFMHAYPEELERIDTVLLCAPSVGGMHFLGELLSGNFNISPVGLCDFIQQLSDEQIIPDFLYLMEEAGILEIFLDALAEPALKKAVYEGVVDVARDFLATLPTLWVCVPDEYFESAMEFLYGENYKDPNHTYAKLISEVTHYHYDIANKAADIYLQSQQEHEGLNVAIVAKFGTAAVPLFSGENIMDDGLVTLPISSYGATCTNYGESFPDDYKQQKYTDYNFMSPEWNIDASTCAFPFSTWYIKGLGHGKKNSDYNRFIEEIIFKDLDVFSDPERPQFLTVSPDDPEMLEPLMPAEEKRTTFLDMIYQILKALAAIPKKIFEMFYDKPWVK